MRFDEPPVTGRFLRRYKRFFADIELADGCVLTAHCPNTGGLLGCKAEGSRVWLRDSRNPERKLRFTWQAIEIDGVWINVDTLLPNRVVREAVEAKRIPALRGYSKVRAEVPYGKGSRIDLLLSAGGRPPCYVEVKSTTYTRGKTALFPDAVTERGRKHLTELEGVVRKGARAVQFFFVNRDDVTRFRPADEIDPAYAHALRRAAANGVEVQAWRVAIEPQRIELAERLRVELREPAGGRRPT